jgi:DNA-binding MarR family transcriptional regulator
MNKKAKIWKGIKHPVISAVIAGLILSFLSWASGIFPLVNVWGDKAIMLFKGNLDVPTWSILLLFFVFVSMVVYSIIITIRLSDLEKSHRELEQKLSSKPATTNTLIKQNHLSDLEVKILQFHAGLQSGYGMTGSEIEKEFKLHREEGQYYLEKLDEKGYIEFAFEADTDESAYQLTKKGRSYLVENKLLPKVEK